jgi:hypothetical protein
MKRIFAAMSLQWQRLVLFAAYGVLIVLASVSLPSLFDLMGGGIDWIKGLFSHPDELWKECPRCL